MLLRQAARHGRLRALQAPCQPPHASLCPFLSLPLRKSGGTSSLDHRDPGPSRVSSPLGKACRVPTTRSPVSSLVGSGWSGRDRRPVRPCPCGEETRDCSGLMADRIHPRSPSRAHRFGDDVGDALGESPAALNPQERAHRAQGRTKTVMRRKRALEGRPWRGDSLALRVAIHIGHRGGRAEARAISEGRPLS